MAKRQREPDSDGTTAEAAECNTVFVDTSLDTHLAMLVFKSDTVSDFKKKIVLEHIQCFPKIMDIRIHSLKVKRKARFYHLPDCMPIWSAFHGAKGNWFLSADTSSTSACHLNPNSSDLGLTECAAMDVRNVDNSCRSLSSDIDRIQQTISISLPETIPRFTVKNSSEKTSDIQNNNFSWEKCTETESPSMKKRKKAEQDVCHNPSSKDSDALFHASVTDTAVPDVVSCGKSMVDVESLNLCEQQGKSTEVSGLKNDRSVLDNRVAFEGLFVPAVGEKSNLGPDKRKADTVLENEIPENLMANSKEYELGQNVGLMDAQETALNIQDTENPKSETTSIRKKQKKSKKAMKSVNNDIEKSSLFQLSTGRNVVSKKREPDEENQHSAGNGYADVPVVENSENTDNTDKKAKKNKKKKRLATSDAQGDYPAEDQKNRTGKNSISFAKSEPDGIHEASSQVLSCQSEEKSNLGSDKREAGTVLENEIPENLIANPKEYELGQNVGLMDAQETAVNIQDTENPKSETMSIGKKHKKKKKTMKSANGDIEKSGLFQLPTGHNVVSEKREPDEENQHSAGNDCADIPVVENSENTDKKTKMKKKKKRLATSDAQGDYPAEDQKNPTPENSISLVKFEPDGIHEASSKVLTRQSEEKPEEKHEIAVKTDDPARTTEDKGEGINFKEFFVPCKVKNANQSSMEMKSLKKVKTNDLSSVSISTEVQSSSKLSADHESKSKSHVREDSGKRQGDSAHNSDSSRRSSRVLENGVKDCSNSEMPETSLRKPTEIIGESSTMKRKNASLVKSSLEKFPGKSGNKRSLFGLNVTNRMEIKTPKKKSLLAKPGALFKNFSGESSGDENGTAHSSGSTQSPSDSSSMSEPSISESNLSQDSARNRSSDAQGRSTRGKGTSKLDLLDSEEMTMDMILRSSKRFKKAKLIASQNEAGQNESELIEFVPDSLPLV